MIEVTHFTDPGCPWAYSAWPAHTTLRWRFRESTMKYFERPVAAKAGDQFEADYGPLGRFGFEFI